MCSAMTLPLLVGVSHALQECEKGVLPVLQGSTNVIMTSCHSGSARDWGDFLGSLAQQLHIMKTLFSFD